VDKTDTKTVMGSVKAGLSSQIACQLLTLHA